MKKLLFISLMFFATLAMAQKVEIVSGNFDFLKDQTQVNVVWNFDEVKFYDENYTEEVYLERRKEDVINNPKRGEKHWKEWSAEWGKHRNSIFLEKFILGTKKFKKITFGNNISTPYTLIVTTNHINPGWHGGIMVQPAIVSTTLTFVNSANQDEVLLVIKMNKIEGTKGKNDFVMEYGRISSAFETIGRKLGGEIKKQIK